MKTALLQQLACPVCRGGLALNDVQARDDQEVLTGLLRCEACGRGYPVAGGIPDLRSPDGREREQRIGRTYGYVWSRSRQAGGRTVPSRLHIERVRETAAGLEIQGPWALEIGCGPGRDIAALAAEYPGIQWIGMDIHAAWPELAALARQRSNLHFVRGSALAAPFPAQRFGFAYSYGVLHHTPDPEQGFRELVRVLAPGRAFAVYLYEAHEGSPAKRAALAAVTVVRGLTRRLPPTLLYGLCTLASPLVVLCFSWPARLLSWFPGSRALSARIPFHFGRGLFSLTTDLYDRFGSPIERRYTAAELQGWYRRAGLDARLAHPADVAGWIGWGWKRDGWGAPESAVTASQQAGGGG